MESQQDVSGGFMANLVCVYMCVIVAGRHVVADKCVSCVYESATSRCIAVKYSTPMYV